MCHFIATGHTNIVKIVYNPPSAGSLTWLSWPILASCVPSLSLTSCACFLVSTQEDAPCSASPPNTSRHTGQPFGKGSALHGLSMVPSEDPGSSHRPSSQVCYDHVSTPNGLCLLRKESASPSCLQIHVGLPQTGEKTQSKRTGFFNPSN